MASLNDNSLLTANDLGILSGALDISDTFDATDRLAFYKFTLTQNSDLAVSFSGTSIQADLIADLNSNGIVENNEVINTRFGLTENFLEPLPVGTYFLQVQTFSTQPRGYTVRLAETPKPGNVSPDPGNSLEQAFSLGGLTGRRVLADYVGDLDELDIYRFTLNQKSNLGIVVSGETRTTPVGIITDRNANGVIDSNEQIASRFSTGDSFSATLSPGTYFIVAGQILGTVTTQYTLTITQTPDFSGNDTLRGNSGRNVIRGFQGNDTILGFGGNDLLFGNAGNDRLIGDGGNDRLVGNGGNDILVGGAGRDILLGGGGNDILDGGSDSDTIVTGGGRDRIVLQRGQGFDRVTDFRNGQDTVDLVGVSYGQLTLRQQGNDVLIRIGNANALLLENTNLRLINQADFV